jgi:capsular polysaccharide biosynthesis protein
VRIQQKVLDPTPESLQASQELAETYAKIVDSGALDGRIRRILGSQVPAHAPGSFSVSANPVQNVELVWLTARSRLPVDAKRVANAVPAALREFIHSTSVSRDQIVAVKPAAVPTSPASPDKTLDLAVAVLLGLIFNSALVLLIDRLSDRLPDDLESSLGYPVIATIPALNLVSIDPESRPVSPAGVRETGVRGPPA